MKANYGMCTIDMVYDSRIIDVDEGFTKMLGYKKADLASSGITYRSLMVQDKNDEGFKSLTDNTINNGMACVEHFIRRKDGSVINVSCFGRNRGDDKIDIMITEDKQEWNSGGGGYDRLTGFYNYAAARAEIARLLKRGGKEYHSCILMRLRNVEKMDELYGSAFTGAIIENTAMYISRYYSDMGVKIVPGRLSRDTFLVFECGDEPEKVEKNAKWISEELKKSYYGRRKGISAGIELGISHMDLGDDDFEKAFYTAGLALEYADKNGTEFEIYDRNAENRYSKPEGHNIEDDLPEENERVFDYDNRFVSFAVALLANARDPESSLDVLLQRTAWKYKFQYALVCRFEKKHYVRVVNRYVRGVGIALNEDEVLDMNDWDKFMRSFDHNGISRIDDTSAEYLSDEDREFFRIRKVGSALNFLLHDNGLPAGYVSYCRTEKSGEWDRTSINTLIQVSKIIEIFLSQRIRNEEEEKRLRKLSKDFVTGLYVLPAFVAEAEKILKNFDENKCYAVVHTDIDNFAYFNSNYGVEVGERILKMYADIIDEVCREGGLSCHMEEDIFICLLIRDTKEEIEEAVKKMGRSFHELNAGNRALSNLRSSSGVYFMEKNKLDLKEAMSNASLAWKTIMNDGLVPYRIYDDEFRLKREHKLEVISSVRSAIENGEIEAFFQPKFSMKTMTVVGAEALCRWRNPDGSYRFPDDFIPILENEGQIVDIDFCIFEQVLQAIESWKDSGFNVVPVSVNFSRAHVGTGNFAEKIIAMAESFGVEPKYLEIEITESTISSNDTRMLNYMNELRRKGFKVTMDDFGTGASSLNMLLDAPIDVVKVDKGFMDRYENPLYRAYIDSIGNLIIMAKKEIIFEGVETQEQIDFLLECGYDTAQGYFFSKPITLREFEDKYIFKNTHLKAGTQNDDK
ncbi:MAG: EAL domain-containing protein [bacterium]|nr:EAL domain-containing protein [bacterium]